MTEDDRYCRDRFYSRALGRYTLPCMREAGHGPVTRQDPHRDFHGVVWFPADSDDAEPSGATTEP